MFRRYLPSKVEDSSEIAPNFACFWPPIFLGEGEPPPKKITLISKLSTLPITVQNFAAIGRRRSKISQQEKKKNARKMSVRCFAGSGPKTVITGRTKKPIKLLVNSFIAKFCPSLLLNTCYIWLYADREVWRWCVDDEEGVESCAHSTAVLRNSSSRSVVDACPSCSSTAASG